MNNEKEHLCIKMKMNEKIAIPESDGLYLIIIETTQKNYKFFSRNKQTHDSYSCTLKQSMFREAIKFYKQNINFN